MKKIFFLFLILFIFYPLASRAENLGEKLSGRILLNVEKNGEAWYVCPVNHRRYYLGRPKDAFAIMRELGLGITEINFQRLAQAGMPIPGDIILARKLAGRIVLEVEKNGEAWYINPLDLKKYYLGRPKDAFAIMRRLGLGITRENLARIHKPGIEESLNHYSEYEYKKIKTKSGVYAVDLITINLNNPNLKIKTLAARPYPQKEKKNKGPFGAQSLGKFVLKNNGFAGINGTYFCSSFGCGAANYYFFPIYDSNSREMINADQLKYWTTGPIMAFDTNNKFYYFKDSREFGSVVEFEKKYNVKLAAAIGNKPRLIENGKNLLIEWDIDKKQRDIKSLRNAIGYKNNNIYLVVAHNATVPDLADIMQALNITYALNLDGGNSSALWYNDEYMAGPGRDIANAIVFSE